MKLFGFSFGATRASRDKSLPAREREEVTRCQHALMSATVAPDMAPTGDAASAKGASNAGVAGATHGDVDSGGAAPPPSPFGRHLSTLLRKNFLLQRRVPGTTLLELILPILFVGLMSAIW